MKNELVVSLLEYARNKVIIHVSSRDLMILHDWNVIKQINDPSYSNTLKYWIKPLPGFDVQNFPFLICSGWMTFNIINIRDFMMEPLIKIHGGSAKGPS